MTEDEMRGRIIKIERPAYGWVCPMCGLVGDVTPEFNEALEDLRYHINEDHKGED